MERHRKKYSPEFKAKVALAAAKGQKTLSELAAQYSVHANQISKWKAQLLESAPGLFRDGRQKKKEKDSIKEEQLYEQIGRLKMDVDWLKKSLMASAGERRALVEPNHQQLSVRHQCELLGLNRSTYYYKAGGP